MDVKKEDISSSLAKIGKVSFIIGITLSVLSGLYMGYTGESLSTFVLSLLILIGLIIGLINVTPKETLPFIFSVISIFLVMAYGGNFLKTIDVFGMYIDGIVRAMMIMFIPSMIIVALKTIWDYAVDV